MRELFEGMTIKRGISLFALALLFLVVSASLVFAANAQTSTPTALQLRAAISVDGPQIQIGDLFENAQELSEIVLADAPLPGRKLALNPAYIVAQVSNHGGHWNNPSKLKRIMVKRTGRRLERKEIHGILLDYLQDNGEGSAFELGFNSNASAIFVPKDMFELPQIEYVDLNPTNGVFVATLIPYPDAEPITLRGRAWPTREVPVLNRPIRLGQEIMPDDVVWQSVRADRLGQNPVLQEIDLVGKAAKRSLVAGKPIRQTDIKTPDAVTKGQLISISYEVPGIKLTARGKVLANAGLGDLVRAVNLQSSRTIDVTITGPGTAIAVPANSVGG